MPTLIGHSLGRYHILEQLGEGGMATVYKAYDTRLERDVAIKIIRKGAFPSDHIEHILKRFEREAKALARLAHPNIVKVHDYGEHEGSPYLVMEYLHSGTLKQKMGKPMPWQEAVRLLSPIASALEYAHQHDIVHRDIKPSNILITENGQPMLSDFGVAKLLNADETMELTGTGVGIGTPEYMAPEQGSSKTFDHRVDIYSLGVVFYEMVTGRKPYTADTPLAVLIKRASEPLPRPKQFTPDLPQVVENVIFKALAKEPKDRYHNMGDFINALEGLMAGKAVAKKNIPPKTNVLPARPPARRAEFKLPAFPRRTVITLGLIALGIGLFAFFLPRLKSLPTTFSPTAAPSDTPTLLDTPTSTITATLQATHTPPASPTPTLGIGSTWTRPSDGMEMVYVPEGEFTMGSNDGPDDEKPAHQVYLDAYWIDLTEVTNGMFAKCVLAGPCKHNPGTSMRSSDYNEYPVAYVEWNDARSYCSWAGGRLPTEAEWEKAAYDTDGRMYPWGNDKDPTKYYKIPLAQDIKPVGSYPSGASPYGALDMIGSVYEWVNDWYGSTYYQDSPLSNPKGPANGDRHVVRGSEFIFSGGYVRSSSRYRYKKVDFNIGFRCASSISP